MGLSDTRHQPNSQGRCELEGEGGLNDIVHVLQIIVKLRVDNDMNSLIVLRSLWRHSFVIVALLIFNIWRESRGCHLFTALKKCFLNQALELEADYELLHGAGLGGRGVAWVALMSAKRAYQTAADCRISMTC